MKKVLSILLSLALCLGMFPGAALAEGDVAEVTKGGGTVQFATLQEAVNSVGENETATIKLLSDVTLNSTLEISGSAELILDLAGHTITCSTTRTMLVTGTVTIQDESEDKSGKVISTSSLAIAVPGTLTLEGGTFEGNSTTIQSKSGNNVADLLGSGYAYYRDSAPILLEGLLDNLTGTITVKECEHPGISNNDGTHDGTCPYCGTELAITKPTELTVSGVTVESRAYDGTNVVKITGVTVALQKNRERFSDNLRKKKGV